MIRLLPGIVSLFLVVACCKKNEHTCNTDKVVNYNIETIMYWDIPNTDNDSIPFIKLKVDTLNYIGSSIRYSENGVVIEQIVILDKDKAIKLDYANDTIVSNTLCRYTLRRNHPTQEDYSIVVY